MQGVGYSLRQALGCSPFGGIPRNWKQSITMTNIPDPPKFPLRGDP